MQFSRLCVVCVCEVEQAVEVISLNILLLQWGRDAFFLLIVVTARTSLAQKPVTNLKICHISSCEGMYFIFCYRFSTAGYTHILTSTLTCTKAKRLLDWPHMASL